MVGLDCATFDGAGEGGLTVVPTTCGATFGMGLTGTCLSRAFGSPKIFTVGVWIGTNINLRRRRQLLNSGGEFGRRDLIDAPSFGR